ncbi:MAG TPA: GTP cyclohydrolase II [Candidatus Sulfotelmatobacter sp.]|jgi:3,4-dihydroxy 2-butanone 4-phosphate synthase/GTP cyclohydrolase II|nr:GTP cyclohydrolase II [Candidatus Sulfotelmatobacter sp.]
MSEFETIPAAIDALRKGKMLIVVDSPDRENQADIMFPAELVTEEKINFLMQVCRGFICVPITSQKAWQLDLPPMVAKQQNTEKTGVNFTVTVDAKDVTDFGISAADRVKTIQTITKGNSKPTDLVRPGHMFPLLAAEGGLLKRQGHTEATVALCELAGFQPVGVLCEILRGDGKVARFPDLIKFARKNSLNIISIHDIIQYIKHQPEQKQTKKSLVLKQSSSSLPTKYGIFQITIYKSFIDNKEHAILSMGSLEEQPVLARIHSQCLTGDTLLSLRCDCREQLHQSMQKIAQKGSGILLYLNQEGRGIGLANKIKAYALQEKGLDTVEANHAIGFSPDIREYEIAADILHDFGINRINLLTNNPNKIEQLMIHGIHINKRIPLEITPQQYNKQYLKTKKLKMNHLLENM